MAIDILVVEDEYTERQELTQLLETVTPPEHIRSAATCSAAIAAISQLCPDLILLDIMLRGSSGFEVAEFVRSNRLDCKIIILTAYHEFDFASKALSMDLQDYLLKPVRPSVLLQRVRDVLHLSSPARAATGLSVWPYLACGISSPLPPIPNLLPNMTVVSILREEVDREVVSQTNLALHGTGWTEQDGRRVIGYCRTAPQQSPEEAAEPLVAAWRQRLEGLAAVGIGGPSEQGLAESYRTACRAADCRIFHPEGTLVCRDTASDVPEPYPLKAEGQLLHALRSEEGGLEEACRHMGRCMTAACNGDAGALREQLTLLWAGIARLCAESALPPPERLTTEGIFTVEQLCRRIQTVCEDVRCQLVLVRDSEHPLVQAALTAIQLRFREPLKLETVAKEQYVNAAYLGRIFRAQTGQSFRDALTEERMRRAERLLRQQVSVSDTAVAVGYSDSNYFSRAYKKYFGHSPSESGPLRTH